MRVTQNTNFDTVRNTITKTKGRMEHLQNQAGTLKKLNTPSDDPIGAAKVLEIRTDKVNNDQFQMNAKMAEAFLNNSDHAISELADIVVRAKEIALAQASGASSNESTRLGVSEEVSQLYSQAVSAANRRIGDRYLFGGYKTDSLPVTADGQYVGDNGQIMVEISREVYLPMNLTGLEVFNTKPESSFDFYKMESMRAPASERTQPIEDKKLAENVNVFNELQNLRIFLLTGDVDGIRSTLDRFDQLHSSLLAARAKVGSRASGLESTHQSLERHKLTNAQLSSNLEDADMAQVMSDIAKEETVLRSVLSGSQRLVQPTLMDFLK